ncbi:hypothetical protein ITJ86_02135 [Winogradskyella sp. F6397]|uniref:Uncharacterized protein n=1 Tax=Winogradskyella marina TaxID=2785530 RepID=A0ABS0EJ43_9FLAO|nr:hypothetical protein [Winogradskyella marina]MBF8148676.1 hypothetical protein [Winogradskyella marina]
MSNNNHSVRKVVFWVSDWFLPQYFVVVYCSNALRLTFNRIFEFTILSIGLLIKLKEMMTIEQINL